MKSFNMVMTQNKEITRRILDINDVLSKVDNYCHTSETNIQLVQEIDLRKQLEIELKNLHEDLEEKMYIRTRELEKANQKLNEIVKQQNITEEKLRTSEGLYRDILENTIEGIFQTTQGGKYIHINRSLAGIYGYSSVKEMLIVLNDIENQLYVDPKRRCEFKLILEKQNTIENFESQIYKKDGTVIWIKENARSVRDSDGVLLYYEGTVTDINRRRNATEAIIMTNKASNRFVPYRLLKLLGKSSIIDLKLNDNIHQRMTILFADIRSFTTLSEQLTPIENFNFLNSFLSRMGPIIKENEGFIDKYIGDSIMALFNNAQDAYIASLEMLKELKQYNQDRRKSGYNSIKIGIGINTGDVIVGIIGEEDRLEGTVIGNTVNTASRIEQLTKTYNVPLLIGEDTFKELTLESQENCRFIDTTTVKGKKNEVTIFEVKTFYL